MAKRVLFLAPLLAIGYAAYQKPAQDDYEDYGGGGYGGPIQRNPVQPQYQPAAPVQPQYRPPAAVQPQYRPPAPVQPEYRPPAPVQPEYRPPAPVQPEYRPPARAPQGGGGGGGGGSNDYNDPGYDVADEWKPYSFSYSAQDTDGSHSHQQQADSRNRVTGQYSIMMADGRMRIVKYVADENGFRAQIVTNEQGTESKNPADVTIQSSAQTGEEAAKQYGNSYSNSRYDNYAAGPDSRPYAAGPEVRPPPYAAGPASRPAPYASGVSGLPAPVPAPSIPPPPPTRAQSFSNSQNYAKQDTQSYSHHNNQDYSQGHSDYPSTGYSSSRGLSQGYTHQSKNNNHHSAAAPYPRQPGGSYSNDIPDLEDHEDGGYYSGTGSRNGGRSPPSYGR
ncbi:pro-resilin-like [Galendromus occidentalis]|uniref:Pro-resilin-like n=1 Tax=Galendromus occidentalis TaxID=34638 RepID=A0AAJ7PA20_9ACAR|nr:pro-resilin-like [Galendromus occidentalis]